MRSLGALGGRTLDLRIAILDATTSVEVVGALRELYFF